MSARRDFAVRPPKGGDMQDLSKQVEQESNPKDETEVQVLTEMELELVAGASLGVIQEH
jgi:hypothetical protein